MKNNLTLEQIYLKSKGLLKEQAENEFVSSVKLSVFPVEGLKLEIDAPSELMVKYTIEPEYRSYGIKEISVGFVGAAPFSFDAITYDENGDEIIENVDVNFSNLNNIQREVDFNVGQYGQVFPSEIEVHIGNDLAPSFVKLIF